MKRFFASIFAALTVVILTFTAALGAFDDVAPDDWFAPYVEAAAESGLVYGKGGGIFDPGGTLTVGEAAALAERLRDLCGGGITEFMPSEPSDKDVTRMEFAQMIRGALPDDALAPINEIRDGAICDVTDDSQNAVYDLYRAGIMAGSDRYGTFYPERTLTRAEACAILARVIDPSLRLRIKLPTAIAAEEIYNRSADAVFMLELYDRFGESIRTGSGFFISSDGLAVTNEHVIAGAVNAIVTLNDGRKYPVSGVCAANADFDLAVISVDLGGEKPVTLPLSDSSDIETGADIYALGSPLELLNSISAGVISNSSRAVEDRSYFQFTASISFGSGGGPVLNTLGQVIGVACSSFTYGQRINLAVPISRLNYMEIGDCKPLG